MPTDISTAFLTESQSNLRASHARIKHCLNQLADADLWHRPTPQMNSIANLLLHLSGNIGQWLISAIHNTPDTRNRPAEFAARGPIPKADLQSQFEHTITQALAALNSIQDPAQLLEPRHIQGNDTTILAAIYRVVTHLQGHTQEIIAMTRTLRGDNYQFFYVPKVPEEKSAQ